MEKYQRFHVRSGLHCSNGSPTYPLGQVQIGLWLNVLHSAPRPQVPSHGFRHFWFIQANCWSHSLLVTHSGRQFGGWPMKSGWHEHVGRSPITRQMLWLPHGLGSQGLAGGNAVIKTKMNYFNHLKRKKIKHSMWTYVFEVFVCIQWMDHLDNFEGTYKLEHDSPHYILYFHHTRPDTGLCNVDECKPFHRGNLNYKRIPVGSRLHMHHQYMAECMCIWLVHFHSCTENYLHMVKDGTGQYCPFVEQSEYIQWMHRLQIQANNYRMQNVLPRDTLKFKKMHIY